MKVKRSEAELKALKQIPVLTPGMWIKYHFPKSGWTFQGSVTSRKPVKVNSKTKVTIRLTLMNGGQESYRVRTEDVVIATLTRKLTDF